jgi:hypothetical protein
LEHTGNWPREISFHIKEIHSSLVSKEDYSTKQKKKTKKKNKKKTKKKTKKNNNNFPLPFCLFSAYCNNKSSLS